MSRFRTERRSNGPIPSLLSLPSYLAPFHPSPVPFFPPSSLSPCPFFPPPFHTVSTFPAFPPFPSPPLPPFPFPPLRSIASRFYSFSSSVSFIAPVAVHWWGCAPPSHLFALGRDGGRERDRSRGRERDRSRGRGRDSFFLARGRESSRFTIPIVAAHNPTRPRSRGTPLRALARTLWPWP